MHTQCTHVFEEHIDLGFGKGIWKVDHLDLHPMAEPCPVSAHFVEIGDIYRDVHIYTEMYCHSRPKTFRPGHSLTWTVNVVDRSTQTVVSYTHGECACVSVF